MKKSLQMIVLALALALTIGGCASKNDIEDVRAQNMEISAKADQAALDAQTAKSSADEAILKANEAIARAEAAEQRAIERERVADEKINRANAAFTNSMRK
ncbi:Lpp/OprI family alanine-zipper lipoprotein [Desulfogranum japonicum]|uniref:Lpp/OprI family alanine-zipper lipoprotein n=1 Tax=Desulfogranum japonicum TaxID=231447 RepID=UPI0003F6206E|nr:Lpp/OprI family alanine-zipper lipoprotein [Desulfogranum japonicum]